MTFKKLNHPLMHNNFSKEDVNQVIKFLKGNKNKIFTQSKKVKEFEEKWSKWLGSKYSVFVNSGSSANLLTILALKIIYGKGEIIVPSLTWISDIASVIQNDFKPVFVDINQRNLCMDEDKIIKSKTPLKSCFSVSSFGMAKNNKIVIKPLGAKKIWGKIFLPLKINRQIARIT